MMHEGTEPKGSVPFLLFAVGTDASTPGGGVAKAISYDHARFKLLQRGTVGASVGKSAGRKPRRVNRFR